MSARQKMDTLESGTQAPPEKPEQDRYDPHRLLFHMSLVGVTICCAGMLLALLAIYRDIGTALINLPIDRLGDYLSSPMALAYNFALVLSGLCFMLAMYGLLLLRYHALSQYLAITGICVGLGISLIGIFPYNDPLPHRWVSLFFVLSTLVLFILLIVARLRLPPLCSRPMMLVAIAGLISTLALLSQLRFPVMQYASCVPGEPCPVAITIWLHTLFTLLTGGGLALMARRLMRYRVTAAHRRDPLRFDGL
jgi:hypothetical membrane protein